MAEILLALLGCAALLGLIALYFRFVDAEVIDEEEETAVEHETAEEHARARLEEDERLIADEQQAEPHDGSLN